MTLAGVDAVAFDLDWTLCFYEVSIAQALAGALRQVGCPDDLVGDLGRAAVRYETFWAEEEEKRASAKVVRERTCLRLLREAGARGRDLDLASPLAEAYAAIRMPSIRLFDGVRELLGDLRVHYRLGLLTNGEPDMQWPKIKTLGIEESFDVIVVSGDTGVYKPDRRAFEILLARLGTEPGRALFVGDSPDKDVAGAKGAGMRVAWVRTDGVAERDVAPDLVVSRTTDLRRRLL